VGRGPLAGPVVAAAVILPESTWIDGVDDSKRLSADRRLDLYQKIVGAALVYGVGAASPREIDRINIRRATALAMQRAIARLGEVDHLLVDGLAVPELGTETHTAIVGGDGCVHCISAASIIAKVTRDRLMARLSVRYPEYGWERNMGYGTPEHLDALNRLGPTRHHRQSFQPCQLDFADALLSDGGTFLSDDGTAFSDGDAPASDDDVLLPGGTLFAHDGTLLPEEDGGGPLPP